jgi:hypothetical protein
LEARLLTDYEEAVKQAKKAKRHAMVFLKKQFGDRCPIFEESCAACQRWKYFDRLFDLSMYEPGPGEEGNPFQSVLSDDEYVALRTKFPSLNRPNHIELTDGCRAGGYQFCIGVHLYLDSSTGRYTTRQFPNISFSLHQFYGCYAVISQHEPT